MSQLFAERFKSARNLNGLSLQQLADKVNNRVSRQALHKYEKGEVLPDSEMIKELSHALQVRPDYFFRETQVVLGEIEFRKIQRFPAKEKNKLIEKTREIISRYLELEDIIGIKTEFKNPLKNFKITSIDDVETAADKLREEWSLGNDPIYNVVEMLEDKHIKVVELEGMDGFDGMQTLVNENIPVIALNSTKLIQSDRKRFTALHELGHLLLDLSDFQEKEKEKFCHYFAGALLFPKSAAIDELGIKRTKLFINELAALKMQHGISIQALTYRLKNVGIISDSYCKQFIFYMVQQGWRIEEPVKYIGLEKSTRFIKLLYRALAEDLISISKAAALKNQKLVDFKKETVMA